MTDFSAYPWRVISYIGDNGTPMDISRAIAGEEWAIAHDSLDVKGWCGARAELTIWAHPAIEDIWPRTNPLRWNRGNKFTFELWNGSAWVLVKTLRILDRTYNLPDEMLTLSLGCLYTLKETRRPPAKAGQVTVGVDYSIRDWANFQLQFFGLPQLATGLGDPALDLLIRGSMHYDGGGSIMDHLGAGVYSNTGCVLYIDEQERSRVCRPELLPTAAAITAQQRNCDPCLPSDGEREKVAGRVRVLGNPQVATPYQDPPATTTTTTTGAITRTETVTESTTLTTRTIITQGTETVTGLEVNTGGGSAGGPYKTTIVEEYAGGTPDIPNPDPDLEATPGSPPWLVRVTTTQEQTPEAPAGGSGGSFGLKVAKEEVKEYFYYPTTADGLPGMTVRKIVTTIKRESEFEASSGGGSGGSGGSFNTDYVETEEWDRLPDGRYRYRKTTFDPTVDQSDRRATTVTSSPGSSEPPATQFRRRELTVKNLEVIGIARFSYPIGAPQNDDPRDYNLGRYVMSREIAEERAKELGALLIGRYEGWDIGARPPISYYQNWKPYQAAFIERPAGGVEDCYLIDGESWLQSGRRSFCAFEGVWLGDRVGGEIVQPYANQVRVLATVSPVREILTMDGRVIQLV